MSRRISCVYRRASIAAVIHYLDSDVNWGIEGSIAEVTRNIAEHHTSISQLTYVIYVNK